MRIEKGQLICGYPAMDLRKLLRKWPTNKHLDGIQEVMSLPREKAQVLLDALIAEGFVEVNPDRVPIDEEDTHYKYVPTVKGGALAQASASKPIGRDLARKRLHELIERMSRVNDDPQFVLGVEEAFVFGSYLSGVDKLGDLDVSYTSFRKIEDGRKFAEAVHTSAQAQGHTFRSFMDELTWPWRHVESFLKNRSPVYSLGHNEGLLADPSIPRIVIFSGRKPVPNWREL